MPGKTQLNEKGSWKSSTKRDDRSVVDVSNQFRRAWSGASKNRRRISFLRYHFYNTNRLFRTSLRQCVGEETDETTSTTQVGKWQFLW